MQQLDMTAQRFSRLSQQTKLRIRKDGSSQVAHNYFMNLMAPPQIFKLLVLTVSKCKHKHAKFCQFLKDD